MSYGNAPPPEGAPVPPQELIGASIFVGLVSVLTISRHGPYLIALILGRTGVDAGAIALIILNGIGFTGSLWLLALRRWAWALCLGYCGIEVALRAYYFFSDVAPGIVGSGPLHLVAGIGELLLGLVLLVVLAFLCGPETREQLEVREQYRRAAAADRGHGM